MNLSDTEFRDVRQLIQDLCGICLSDDKRYLIQSRIEPILHRNKLETYADLVQRCSLTLGLRLQEEVVEAITTKETSFNRDGHPFEELRRSILPDLIQSRSVRQRAAGLPFGKMRIWSAAISTGQEVYSIGMAILDWLQSQSQADLSREGIGVDSFQILGTDISSEALRIAKQGVYHQRDLDRSAGRETMRAYFIERNGSFEVSDSLKSMVEFRRVNLTKPLSDPSFYELILCRNILIYFDEPARQQVLTQLVERLTPRGILMLGAAESMVNPMSELTQLQFGRTTIYRKK